MEAAGEQENVLSIVKEFEAAFNRQDMDALVACFTPGSTYRDTFHGDYAGTAALRDMFEQMFREGRVRVSPCSNSASPRSPSPRSSPGASDPAARVTASGRGRSGP